MPTQFSRRSSVPHGCRSGGVPVAPSLRLLTAAASFAVGFVATTTSLAETRITYRIVATSSQPAPGVESGIVFNSFEPPSSAGTQTIGPAINASGDVCFRADLRQGFSAAGRALYVNRNGATSIVAREGFAAAGTAATFMLFERPIINEFGQVAFVARLNNSSPFVTDYGIWTNAGGSLSLIAREGMMLPSAGAGVTIADLDPATYAVAFNRNGRVAFEAALSGTGVTGTNDWGLYATVSGILEQAAREGGQAPGLPQGVVHAEDGAFISFGYNNTDVLAFATRLSGPGVISTVNDSALFRGTPLAVSLLHRASDPVPGVANPGVSQIVVQDITLGNSGNVAFLARFREPPTNITRIGVFTGGLVSGLRLIAADGEPAPGSGLSFDTNGAFSFLTTNTLGKVALVGSLGNNIRGIWTDVLGQFTMLMRTGAEAPDTPPGTTLQTVLAPALNEQGRLALLGVATAPGSAPGNALWLTDAGGAPRLIAREGGTLDFDPDPNVENLLVVGTLTFLKTPSASGLGDNNEVAFAVRFRDPDASGFPRHAIYVASIVETCIADLDDGSRTGTPDGAVTIEDLLYFLVLFEQGDVGADVDNGSGTGTPDEAVTIDDLLYFLARFEAGC